MGIVVTIAMLLGLVVLRPSPWRGKYRTSQNLRFVTFTTAMLVMFGVWNAFWYGLRHLGSFWGIAALVSGVTMLLAALIIFLEQGDPAGADTTWVGSIREGVVWVLILCFLLYSITLIQLNLGMPILG